MASPLDEFGNSPRRFRNDDGSEVVASSLVKLGPGLIASRPAGTPGEPTFVTLAGSGFATIQQLAALVTAIENLTEAAASQGTALTALAARVTLLEAGGRWMVPDIVVGTSGPESTNLALGSFHRFDLGLYGGGDVMTATLPSVTADSVGRRVAVGEVSGFLIGVGQPELHIATTGGQAIDGRSLPLKLAGTRPRIVFVAVLVSVGVYGWSVESYDAD